MASSSFNLLGVLRVRADKEFIRQEWGGLLQDGRLKRICAVEKASAKAKGGRGRALMEGVPDVHAGETFETS